MKLKSLMTVLLVGAALLLLSAPDLSAHQPRGVWWKMVEGATEGKLNADVDLSGDSEVQIDFYGVDEMSKSYILIVFDECGEDPKTLGRPMSNLEEVLKDPTISPQYSKDWQEPGPIWRVCPKENAVLLTPGTPGTNMFYIDFLRAITQNVRVSITGWAYEISREEYSKTDGVPEYLKRFIGSKLPISKVQIDLFYVLKTEAWYLDEYEDVFGLNYKDQETDGFSVYDYSENMYNLPVLLPDYRLNLQLPGSFEYDKSHGMLQQSLEEVKSMGSKGLGNYICFREDYEGAQKDDDNGVEGRAGAFTLSGKWSVKWMTDHSLHPGFGWKAEAWTNEGGSWRMLTWDWVHSNGNWSLSIPSSAGYEGTHLRMLYRAYNRYYEPKDQNDNKYSWKGPDRSNISGSHNEGHWYADCDGGDANGLGELYNAAYYMWSRLYWTAGVNPLRSSPITLYFPNTWFDCGDGSGVPWSCSSTTSYTIWLTANHGASHEVVVHELSHQLNNEFWHDKRPAGSGGSHSLWNCYPTRLGMALREGFADFMPGWVGYQNRHVAENGFNSDPWDMDFDLETRNTPPNCANGWENEVWVARTFWDLHDTRTDGDDILWYVHKGAVINLYLGNEPANNGDAMDMRDFETLYRNNCSSGHEGFITDIFEQNHM